MKLDIGSGRYPVGKEMGEGWTSVDLFGPSDVRATMWDLPFEDGAVEAILCRHALEHVGRLEVEPTLKEWNRVLAAGGVLTVSVPNMDFIARYWLHGPNRDYAQQILFGNQEREGEFHRVAFNPASLRTALTDAGFKIRKMDVIFSHSQETIVAEAEK